ncbi:MAG: endo-1,4-beta-xylanase [Clostridiales bacterium]|nr:endo-1,4-beta-xylanase [Candidatus Blautia equi]
MRKLKLFLTTALTALALAVLPASAPVMAEEAEVTSIKDAFAEHGMKAGTCLSPFMISNPQFSDLIAEQFNSVTMENAMKPDYIFDKNASITAGYPVVEFNQDALNMMEWAKEHDFALRGHTLVWYSQTPDWIFHEEFNSAKPLVTADVMLDRMDHYISQIFSILEEKGYADLFYAYDIVNEGVEDNGSLRECLWKQTIGDDYIWYAFYYANKYAPENIDLYYNDYNEQFKYNGLIKMVETLKDEDGNYLIDGIGLQGHLYTKDDLNTYFRAMDALAATGLKLQITELDVSLGTWQNIDEATEETLGAQKDFYEKLISGIMERVDSGKVDMEALTFWGFADFLSWRGDRSPLLYDKDLAAKPAFYGVIEGAK